VQAACPGHAVSLLAPASRYAERFIRDVLDGTSLELWIGQGKGSFGRQVADGAQKIAGQAGISTRRLGNGDSCPCPSGPWALVSAGTFEDDVQAVNRARRQPSPPRLIFSVAAGVREFAGEVDDPEGIYGAGQWFPGSTTRAELGPPEDTFLAAYAMVTDQPADYPGVQAAAAAVVAAHCARQARSTARGQLWAQAAALDTATLFGGFRINPVSGAQVKHEAALVRWTYGQLALALTVSPGTSSERAPGPRRKTGRTSLVSVTDAPLLMRPGFAEALRAFCKASSPRSDRLGEPLDEVECRLGDLAPAVVDREGVAPVGDLRDLRDGGVAPLPLVACRSLLGGCGGRACACGWMSSPGREVHRIGRSNDDVQVAAVGGHDAQLVDLGSDVVAADQELAAVRGTTPA
jgi:hypothetical protein